METCFQNLARTFGIHSHALQTYQFFFFCMAYLDDILIYSEMLEEYKEHVEKSLEYTITPGYMERDD